jgi:DNA-binding CsgD family transcriptional regulator
MFVPRAGDGVGRQEGEDRVSDADAVLRTAVARLDSPGLVILAGPPGIGRSTVLSQVGAAFTGPVFAGGGLAMLRGSAGFALSRAVRARLPVHDQALLAEAVRSRVRGGLLLLDDLQWADEATLAALPEIARHCRVAATLRTPHRLDSAALRAVATWLTVPPLDNEAATALVTQLAPALAANAVAALVRRAGGSPLALRALSAHAAKQPNISRPASDSSSAEPPTPVRDSERVTDVLADAVATALADLTRPARTAMAALGLLRRPAAAALLGAGLPELIDAGLVDSDGDTARPVSPYVAEVAAGLLERAERDALHRHLAELVPPREAARHLAAAGESGAAYARAVAAAATAGTAGERAELYTLACELPGVEPEPRVRLRAAAASLAVGWPQTCLRVLGRLRDATADALRGEALLQLGEPARAADAVRAIGDDAPAPARATRDRLLLLELLARDPAAAQHSASQVDAQAHAASPGLSAAVAAVHAAVRAPGWERGLAAAAEAAGVAGDVLTARWCAWLLVETLAGDGRLVEAADTAAAAAQACAPDLAYSWQTRFLAARLWCLSLQGGAADEVLTRAGDLTDRTLPSLARGYASAAAGLVEADGGLLAAAQARLAAAGTLPAPVATLLDWVRLEAAWLDGQPERAGAPGSDGGAPLVVGLRHITRRWAAFDIGSAPPRVGLDGAALSPVSQTLRAWDLTRGDSTAGGAASQFDSAAAAWHDLSRREEVRCLLAHGLLESNAERALPPLLRAEELAESAGLVVLLGRTRRALRRHAVRRDVRGPRSGDELTEREREVLTQVARGEPTRRIAGQLGISRETVETHIRSGMRKLGARTRTEAAALALEVLA